MSVDNLIKMHPHEYDDLIRDLTETRKSRDSLINEVRVLQMELRKERETPSAPVEFRQGVELCSKHMVGCSFMIPFPEHTFTTEADNLARDLVKGSDPDWVTAAHVVVEKGTGKLFLNITIDLNKAQQTPSAAEWILVRRVLCARLNEENLGTCCGQPLYKGKCRICGGTL
jgi:hypothetical protein